MAGLLPNLRIPACGGLWTSWVARSKRGVVFYNRAVLAARRRASYCSSSEAGKAGSMATSNVSVDRQFEEFRFQLEESAAVREKIRAIVSDLDSATRLMQAQLLLIHHSRSSPVKSKEFGLELEDYLVGLCNLSSELPGYVVNQVTSGDYDCAKRASAFLSDLYAAFQMLNLRNDLLWKRFDGMKYNLKKVEEVLYDVKIRGLLSETTPVSAAES